MKHILVIGEHSYIGTSFQKYIEKNVIDVQVTLTGAKDAGWKKEDFSKYDTILHVAAIVHKKEQPDMRQLYHEVNTVFPVELAKKAKADGVGQFLFLSTMAVYGNLPSPIRCDEIPAPVTMYGKSKLEAENQLKKMADERFHVCVFRPPMVYGPNCPGNYKRLAKLACRLPVFPQVKNQRSMIYIENLCKCIYQEIIEPVGEKYRIICPQNVDYINTTELVREIRRAHGKQIWIMPFLQKLIRICAEKNETLKKIFGDCYYEKTKQSRTYQVAEFRESIRRTEGWL